MYPYSESLMWETDSLRRRCIPHSSRVRPRGLDTLDHPFRLLA